MPGEGEVYAIVYVGKDGNEQRCKLSEAAGLPFHEYAPVRKPTAYRRQRHLSGYYFFATSGVLVFYESRLEMGSLMRMDFDPEVVVVAAQPFRLLYRRDNKERSHIPDYFAKLEDGRELVVDVKPESFAKRPKNRQVFKITAEACKQAGWKYKVDTGAREPVASNISWLAGFRRKPGTPHYNAYAEAIVDLCATEPRSIKNLNSQLGHPAAVKPVIFHLLWEGIVQTRLDVRLSDSSLISLPDKGRVETHAFYT